MSLTIKCPTTVNYINNAIAITGVSITDPFAATNPGTMSVTVSCINGTISMTASGTPVPGSLSKTIVMSPTLTAANAALSTLVYHFGSATTDTITITVWDQAGTHTTSTIAITSGAVAPPPPPPVTTGTTAVRARKLSSMFAVNTHIDFGPTNITPQYGNFSELESNINYLWSGSGVKPLLRDSPGNASDTTWWPQIASATGAKFISYIGEASAPDYQSYVTTALSMASIIAYLDGPNEEDSAANNGLTSGVGEVQSLDNAAAFMPTLWQQAQAHNLPVINMSYGQGWGSSYDPNYQHGYYGINGDLSASCTYGNAHTYPQNGDAPHDNIVMLNAAAKLAAVSRPVAITEFGYTIGTGGASVAEDVQAKYALAGFMDAYSLGNVLFGWYAIYDDMSGAWGMFNADYTPRPIATAFKNFLTIMADIGSTATTFTPGQLAYTVTGCTQALFQKSDGSFWLVLWNEQNLTTGQNPTVSVPVTFSASHSLSVFDPMAGTTATKTATGSSITLSVPAYPIVVKIV